MVLQNTQKHCLHTAANCDIFFHRGAVRKCLQWLMQEWQINWNTATFLIQKPMLLMLSVIFKRPPYKYGWCASSCVGELGQHKWSRIFGHCTCWGAWNLLVENTNTVSWWWICGDWCPGLVKFDCWHPFSVQICDYATQSPCHICKPHCARILIYVMLKCWLFWASTKKSDVCELFEQSKHLFTPEWYVCTHIRQTVSSLARIPARSESWKQTW